MKTPAEPKLTHFIVILPNNIPINMQANALQMIFLELRLLHQKFSFLFYF